MRSALKGKALSTPEAVNFNEPPSKLLERLYSSKLNRGYKKVTDGKELFESVDPAHVLAKCPQFKQMIDELLKLAREAGL